MLLQRNWVKGKFRSWNVCAIAMGTRRILKPPCNMTNKSLDSWSNEWSPNCNVRDTDTGISRALHRSQQNLHIGMIAGILVLDIWPCEPCCWEHLLLAHFWGLSCAGQTWRAVLGLLSISHFNMLRPRQNGHRHHYTFSLLKIVPFWCRFPNFFSQMFNDP